MRYGPVAGIGVVDWSEFGVPAGTGAANSSATIVRKSPRGFVSLITIVRFALFVWMPPMSPVSVFENCSAPAMSV